MSWKVKTVVAVVASGCLIFGGLVIRRIRARPPVSVTFSISVSPSERMDFVLGQASSAKLKYEAGKMAGIQPGQAQRLLIKPLTNASMLEIHARVESREAGQLFIAAFMERLQARCAGQAELALAKQSVR
jgi:hypothetical protein